LAILGHGILERGDQCAWIFQSKNLSADYLWSS